MKRISLSHGYFVAGNNLLDQMCNYLLAWYFWYDT